MLSCDLATLALHGALLIATLKLFAGPAAAHGATTAEAAHDYEAVHPTGESSAHHDAELMQWPEFKRAFGRQYTSVEEEAARREIFATNSEFIARANRSRCPLARYATHDATTTWVPRYNAKLTYKCPHLQTTA